MSDIDDDDDGFGDPNDRLPNHSSIRDKSTISKGKTALNHFNKFCQQFWAESGLRFAGFIWVEVVSPTKCYFRAI